MMFEYAPIARKDVFGHRGVADAGQSEEVMTKC